MIPKLVVVQSLWWHYGVTDPKCWFVFDRNNLSHILKLFKYGKEVNGSQNVTNKDSTPFVLIGIFGTSIPHSSKIVAE